MALFVTRHIEGTLTCLGKAKRLFNPTPKRKAISAPCGATWTRPRDLRDDLWARLGLRHQVRIQARGVRMGEDEGRWPQPKAPVPQKSHRDQHRKTVV